MIQHTVTFRLRPGADVDLFFARARALADIDGVENFEVLRQVGAKSRLTHGLSMRFRDQAAYDNYDQHHAHRAFVSDVWIPTVADFLELDFIRDDDSSFRR